MTLFRVWAPFARNVQLVLGGRPVPMQASGEYWSAEAAAAPGIDYSFVLDDREPLPDPRSPWQRLGVHGPSCVVDHAAFQWTDAGWQAPPLASGIVYEIHTGTFTPEGTFDGAIDRIGYLANLGITHAELMPVNEFPGGWGWGYDGVDLFAPHHAYGGPEALKRFVDACHAAGLAVLLDVVYNHLGPAGNYLGRFAPYFTDRYSTPWGEAVNLDGAGSREVRRFFCDNALMWLRDYHFDGLRIDAVHAIFDFSAVHFLEQLATEVKALEAHLGRHLAVIAESDLNDPRIVTPRECGGYEIDAQWSDDFHHALHTVLTGETAGYYADFGKLADLAKALENAYVYDGRDSIYRKRKHGRKPRGLSGSRFLGYLQNHDQVGNRARGERSSQLMSRGRLKMAAALVLCSPFVPMLFQGEEFGATAPFQYFTNHPDPDLGRAVSEGRRREFAAAGCDPENIPDPQDPDTFLRSKINWAEIEQEPHRELLEWHCQLIALRRAIPALTDGRLDRVQVRFCESGRWLAMQRGPVVLACNLGKERQAVPVPFTGALILASAAESVAAGSALELPPDSVAILVAE
ncbi:MAG TPA: malto-oligosyltrehalose trehalohydrolase [Bryobacteraceae bacterium]|nr:malto-oligosyltrehalose trehalohydrolase [Bryobacteraceae bacterium]